MMKRGIWLIVVLLMLFKLGYNGSLYKAAYGPPHSLAVISLASPAADDFGNTGFLFALPPLEGHNECRLRLWQPVALDGHAAHKIIVCCHSGGSGGIPL
jgi:hypothetical protein